MRFIAFIVLSYSGATAIINAVSSVSAKNESKHTQKKKQIKTGQSESCESLLPSISFQSMFASS